ncbi:MAG TPA: hypothetical protein VGR35_22860 [Tepidisphaeraceae bacterium]|nr:hypothetical protein [Tepidisphaeraceae bacterium]
MRMAFGLVSLLVTLGIIILVMSMMLDKQTGSIPVAITAREEAKQIAGVGQDGEAATQSAYFEEDTSGGKLRKLTARRVVPGGAYDTYFGLQKGDEIVEIEQAGNMMKIHDIANGDAGLAIALVSDAYARNQRIIVNRNGQRLTLPMAPGTAIAAAPGAPAAGAGPATAPAAPAPASASDAPSDNRSPLSRQLDLIKGAGN